MKKSESIIYNLVGRLENYIHDVKDVQRVKQEVADVQDGRKTQSAIYTLKIEMDKKPLVLTYKISDSQIEIMVTDKKGQLLEYFVHDGARVSATKNHNFSAEQIRKLLAVKE